MGRKSREKQQRRIQEQLQVEPATPPPLLWHVIVLVLVAFAVYLNALGCGFAVDDNTQILRNPQLRDWTYIPTIFSQSVWEFQGIESRGNYYRPLQLLIYMFTYFAFGLQPFAFHFVNIAFHALATYLAYRAILSLFGNGLAAFAGALLFATHPIHTEAVTWIAALPDVLCAVFYFASFWLYIDGTKADDRRRIRLAYLLFLPALFSKEMAATLPLMAALYEHLIVPRQRTFIEKARRYAPYFAVLTVYAVSRIAALGFFAQVGDSAFNPSRPDSPAVTMVVLFSRYLMQLVAPIHFNFIYIPKPDWTFLDRVPLLSVIGVVALAAFLVFLYRYDLKAFFVCIWIAVTLTPVIKVVSFGASPFAERYLYIPSLGFCALVAWAILKWVRNPTAWVAIGLIAAFYSAQAIRRNVDWFDTETIGKRTVEVSLNAEWAHRILGMDYFERGKYDEAEREIQTIMEQHKGPPNARDYVALGAIYKSRNDSARAIEMFRKGLSIDKENVDALTNLGAFYYLNGQYDRSLDIFQAALKHKPNSEGIHLYLGGIYLEKGQFDRAIREFQEAIRILPTFSEAYLNLGLTFEKAGRHREALDALRRAKQLNPTDGRIDESLRKLGD